MNLHFKKRDTTRIDFKTIQTSCRMANFETQFKNYNCLDSLDIYMCINTNEEKSRYVHFYYSFNNLI